MKRRNGETIVQLLVREEEVFQDLQHALSRARHDQEERRPSPTTTPAGTPTRSPTRTRSAPGTPAPGVGLHGEEDSAEPQTEPSRSVPLEEAKDELEPDPTADTGIFHDELRGYRLLKSAQLSNQEVIRQSLRNMFSLGANTEDNNGRENRTGKGYHSKRIWYAGEDPGFDQFEPYPSYYGHGEWDYLEEFYDENYGEEAYYGNNDDGWEADYPTEQGEETPEKVPADVEEDGNLVWAEQEAYTVALEANRTLQQARAAVAKARAARGFYEPNKGNGKSGFKGKFGGKAKDKMKGKNIGHAGGGKPGKGYSGMGKSPKGKGYTQKGLLGPCFVCGQKGHTYTSCPDRHSGQSQRSVNWTDPVVNTLGRGPGQQQESGGGDHRLWCNGVGRWHCGGVGDAGIDERKLGVVRGELEGQAKVQVWQWFGTAGGLTSGYPVSCVWDLQDVPSGR